MRGSARQIATHTSTQILLVHLSINNALLISQSSATMEDALINMTSV